MSEGISFDQWGSVDQHYARLLARDPDVKPLALRVMFAALGWSNLIGHAEFAQGGLAMVLQSSDPRTGELSIPSRGQVNTAIRRAEAMGLVAAESSRQCLLTPAWWEKSGGRGGKSCTFHNIRTRPERHKRSAAEPAKRHTRSAAPAQEECRSEPLTSANVKPLYDSDLHPVRQDRNDPHHHQEEAS